MVDVERVDDLIAAAALGELDDHEAAELDALVAADPAVAGELAAALEAAAALQTVRLEAPPEHLRGAVLAAISGRGSGQGPVVALPRARAARRPRAAIILAAAAVVALVVGVGVALVGDTVPSRGERIAAVLRAEDRQRRVLVGPLAGTVAVTVSAHERALVVDAQRMSVPPPDRTYQLWVVRGSGPESVGTFRPDADGSVRRRFDGVRPGSDVVAVTEEPAGGSRTPTLPILASA